MDIFWVLVGASYLLSFIVQQALHATQRKWGAVPNSAGMTGAGTVVAILEANAMTNVAVQPVRGRLTDHYDPRNQTISLSESVFAQRSVAAMAIAAHETGHSIQDHVGYGFLKFRTALAPVVNAASRFGLPAAILGVFVGIPELVQLGVLGYVGALGFQFLTLPVEFDASKRALAEIDRLHLVTDEERRGVRSVLRAAAMTYVAGAASAAVYILYIAMVAGRFLLRRPPLAPPPRLP
ncbi:MAG: zinc metallopeptidase [Gammaproteobacteria bacterium]